MKQITLQERCELVLFMIADGYSKKEIAIEMAIYIILS